MPILCQECGDFKRGSCFRATCKFLHGGKPASEVLGGGGGGAAPPVGLPTPRPAAPFELANEVDKNLYDPSTGFGLFGTAVFGTRYGMIGAVPKIENVRPLCMDFFKQGFCNRRGPHNQGCLFRHDEVEGKGKIVDEQLVSRVTDAQVELYVAEAHGRVGVWGKYARADLEEAAKEYAQKREAELLSEDERAKEAKVAEERAAALAKEEEEAAKARAAAAPPAAAHDSTCACSGGGAAAGGEAPLPAGWKATRAADGRTYYYHSATKKTQWTRPQGDPAAAAAAVAAPLPVGWKEAKAPDGRTYYFIPGQGKTQWVRPTEAAPGVAPSTPAPDATAPVTPAPADAAAPSTDAAAAVAPEASGNPAGAPPQSMPAADEDDKSPDAKRARQEE